MEVVLEKIRDFADAAHGEQMRKYTPERYIVHPVRVMQTCKQYDADLPMLAAALLHDVLEDTPVTSEEMLAFLRGLLPVDDAGKTLRLVEELTDVYVKSDYPQWNRRRRKQKELERIVRTSPDAQTIKYADILDNCKEITKYDTGFAPRFLKECLTILEKTDNGNPELRNLALETVRYELGQVGKR